MRFLLPLTVVASLFAVANIGFSATQAAEQQPAQRQDQWRYTFHNGEWWYWLPAGRWVYWRDNRWNDFNPKAYIAPKSPGPATASGGGSSVANRSAAAPAASDTRPFYGHALSSLDRRPLEEDSEVGPFYGHALPTEVFGPWRARRGLRPFYGHAVSVGD